MEVVDRGGQLIPILGMHRSGTSALASALYKLGADLGPESSWLQPAADNPLGFFEYKPLVDLNRDILAAFGGTWSNPPPLPPGWTKDERLTGLRDRAEDLAQDIPERMVVKDPRLSLLQPLWDEVGTVAASIICLRHPLAVANSLQARNQFTIDQGLFLWFRYNAAAVVNRPESRVVEYESLLSDPAPLLMRLVQHIGLDASERTIRAAATTVFRSMAHHTGQHLPDTPVGEVAGRLYDLLRSEEALDSDDEVSTWARLVTELPWAGLGSSTMPAPDLPWAEPGERKVRRLRNEISELNVETDRLTRENEALTRRLTRLQTELQNAYKKLDLGALSETADLLWSLESDPK